MSLPSPICNIVANLQSKDSLTYVNVRRRLLEPSGFSNLSANGKAPNARCHKVNKFNNKKKKSEEPNPTRPGKTKAHKDNECYYCNKNNQPYEGHTHEFRNRLKSARDNSASATPSPAPSRHVVPYRANLTINEQNDHEVLLLTSALPQPVPTIASASAFQTANDKTYKVWIFDRAASFHITADFSHLRKQIRCHVGITVDGGACLHSTHLGSVQLQMEIVGTVLSVTLAHVLYVPDWNETCLISCRKIDMLGRFRMVAEDCIITVQCKSDHSPLVIAELMDECYQVLRLACHNEIYTAAADFW